MNPGSLSGTTLMGRRGHLSQRCGLRFHFQARALAQHPLMSSPLLAPRQGPRCLVFHILRARNPRLELLVSTPFHTPDLPPLPFLQPNCLCKHWPLGLCSLQAHGGTKVCYSTALVPPPPTHHLAVNMPLCTGWLCLHAIAWKHRGSPRLLSAILFINQQVWSPWMLESRVHETEPLQQGRAGPVSGSVWVCIHLCVRLTCAYVCVGPCHSQR